jgi:hypothetical protein
LTAQAGGAVVQSNCSGGDDQLWQVPGDNGAFAITSKTGTCLGINGIDVGQSSCDAALVWTLVPYGTYAAVQNSVGIPHGHPTITPLANQTGTYFEIQYSGSCVDVDAWNHNDGGRIIYWGCAASSNDNQLWMRYP